MKQLFQTFALQAARYLAAMNAAALQSAVHALRSYCGIAGAHEVTSTVSVTMLQVPAINIQQAGCIFLFAFGAGILNYLDAHPITIPAAVPTKIIACGPGGEPIEATLNLAPK